MGIKTPRGTLFNFNTRPPFTKCSFTLDLVYFMQRPIQFDTRMHHYKGFSTALIILALSGFWQGCSQLPSDESALPDIVDYNFHVKPILSDRCYTCHGPDANTREADLRLDTPDGFYALLGEDQNRQAIVPKKPNRSELIRRIHTTNPDDVMPPPESNLYLSDYEKALLERWIRQGASWKPHWAFAPPILPKIPRARPTKWANNPIDRFVLARLNKEGLAPSPRASKELLLRRVTFDLTGLPPTLEEIETFLSDDTPDAYEKVVDRLLASKAYGERMTSDWLDVARYADTGGYQSDRVRRMWPWRDWVIKAFNENLPYSDFLTWQLAGDLLPDATKEQQLATAFNRNHRQTEEGGSIEEEFRLEYVADRTQTTATAFMGLTMDCARCHDHKYDPISQKEYYQFASFFGKLDESGQTSFFTDAVPVPTLLLSTEEQDAQLAALSLRITENEKNLKTLFTSQKPAFETWLARQSAVALPPLPTRDLVTYLPLNQIRGKETPNLAEPTRPGTTVYDPEIAGGHTGNAVLFDGENGIEVKEAGNFKRTEPFSISFWMNASEWNPWNVLVHHTKAALDAGSRGYEISLQENRLVVSMAHMWPQNAMRVISRDTLSLDTWHHVAFTYDGSSRANGLTVYIDGIPAEVEIVRDNLFKNITYEREQVHLTLGYRFRDTGFKDGRIDELRIYDRALVSLEVAQLADASIPTDNEALFAYYLAHHNTPYAELLDTLEQVRNEQNDLVSPIEEIMVMKDMASPRPTHILLRGLYDNKGEVVEPGTPEQLLAFPDSLPSNRLGLAQWLLAPENPLTARVAVNRYWQLFFGAGLVATPEDFGNQGALPSHPALLDWLAVTFQESGWDTKALLKLIAMSATYQQSSTPSEEGLERDPDNILLARGPHSRLPAEMARDQALAASGVLVRTIGGPPVKPYQPPGLWKEKSAQIYVRDVGDGLYRRSLYTYWKRTSPPPSMITFDASRRNQCIVRRQTTTTPLQALVLLNDPQFVEAARILAQRMLKEGGNTAKDRIAFAFTLLTGRSASTEEIGVLLATYNDQQVLFSDSPEDASDLITVGDYPVSSRIPSDTLAAYTMVASTIMNLDASIIKR